ncbi:GNAT family N-acetyltransferase [Saccharospirillum mangrovi]|uniref:GNAT family N-acetyltransferase n=1 Tax=Saccharospirillum mangrovi TaxID=2161747 RepID=UPI000D3B1286|nr:GNAT family N-acetyltransferase [Saccharospirillum mangrovi]
MSAFTIRTGGLDHPAVVELLAAHLAGMAEHSPPESVHALDLSGLQQPSIQFWTAWRDDQLLGCAALKTLDATHGELKSMRTDPRFLRQGVARGLLQHALDQARAQGMTRVSLETGSMDAFAPARAMYEAFGFTYTDPFADYALDPHSVFMTLTL